MISEVAVNGSVKNVHGTNGIISQITQIYIDYGSLPSSREITLEEIRFFYRPLTEGLCELQKLKNGKH
jgi:hypothetical protein